MKLLFLFIVAAYMMVACNTGSESLNTRGQSAGKSGNDYKSIEAKDEDLKSSADFIELAGTPLPSEGCPRSVSKKGDITTYINYFIYTSSKGKRCLKESTETFRDLVLPAIPALDRPESTAMQPLETIYYGIGACGTLDVPVLKEMGRKKYTYAPHTHVSRQEPYHEPMIGRDHYGPRVRPGYIDTYNYVYLSTLISEQRSEAPYYKVSGNDCLFVGSESTKTCPTNVEISTKNYSAPNVGSMHDLHPTRSEVSYIYKDVKINHCSNDYSMAFGHNVETRPPIPPFSSMDIGVNYLISYTREPWSPEN